MEEITVENLHEYLSYNIVKENHKIEITWDGTNSRLNYLMYIEDLFMTSKGYLSNLMWVEKIKDMMDWEEGKIINMWKYTNINPGKITLHIIDPNIHQYQYLQINENGYLLKKTNSDKRDQTFRRCHCLYNELIDEYQEMYILK